MKKNKTDIGHFFEDFKPGHVFECPTPRTLTTGDVSNYIAMTGERTPRFCDSRGEIHPLVVFHTVFGQTVRVISLNARANLGYAELVWNRPVKIGETLHAQAEVVGLKENKGKDSGIVYVKTRGLNADEKVVLEFTRWVMVKKRDINTETAFLKSPVTPKLNSTLTPEFLTPVKDAIPNRKLTGSDLIFDDYQVGERISHVDGASVNPSDHMQFTRLFQNSAKIHFDTRITDGKPLVYGGYPISLGYAQSFNGFQNRTGICGINAGSHANPVYAGDTLYSFTEVLDKKALPGDAKTGALRLRLVVVKNVAMSDLEDDRFTIKVDNPKNPGTEMYNPAVVLDLDYWEQIALSA